MTWTCTDPAYRKDGDEMTWTCTDSKCANVNPDSSSACLGCRAEIGPSAGLSEEERAAWEVSKVGSIEFGEDPMTIEEFTADAELRRMMVVLVRAARAPLESENAKLRERVTALEMEERNLTAEVSRLGGVTRSHMESAGRIASMVTGEHRFLETVDAMEELVREKWSAARERVRELESNHAVATRAHVELGKRFAELEAVNDQCKRQFEAACAREDELEAQLKSTLNIVDTWWNWAVGLFGGKTDLDGNGMREKIKAQLAQAQKPAAPAGLPEVSHPVEVVDSNDGSKWMRATVRLHRTYCGAPAFEVNERAGLFPLSDLEFTWRRVPPAQTSRDPRPIELSADGKRMDGEPAAPLPGEVSTENLDKVKTFAPYLDDTEDDGVAMESSEDGAWLCWEDAMEAARADILAAVAAERERWDGIDKRLRERIDELSGLCRRWGAALTERAKERDTALAEVRDLRAKLEAAERRISEFEEASGEVQGIDEENHHLRLRIKELERRQSVDRERAIHACGGVLFKYGWHGLTLDKLAADIVDAILGAAKEEPAKCEHNHVRYNVDHWQCESCKAAVIPGSSSPAFTPAPTGEAPIAFEPWAIELAGGKLAWSCFTATAREAEVARARAIYALIATDHAAMVKRVRELEADAEFLHNSIDETLKERNEARAEVERLKSGYNNATFERDQLCAEVEHLKAAASQPRRCPADRMSNEDIGAKLHCAYLAAKEASVSALPGMGAKARELFTPDAPEKDSPLTPPLPVVIPVPAPAKEERKVQVGDKVWIMASNNGVEFSPREFSVIYVEADIFGIDNGTDMKAYRHHEDLGKRWWWSDPSAKGADPK